MRRIFIDDNVQEVAQYYKDHLFEKHTRKNFVQPKDGLKALEDEIKRNNTAWSPIWMKYAAYLRNLRMHFDEILLLRPNQFKGYHKTYFSKLGKDELSDKTWRNRNNDISFSDEIVKRMHYSTVRSEDMIPCIKKLGIKTCVYCNAQYTSTIEINGAIAKGLYELDHFLPKDEYPFLCISFYNLQPSCGCCNGMKSDKEVEFNLYADVYQEINPFTFELTPASIIRYMLRQDFDVLEIKLTSTDAKLLANHLLRFHTEDLYKTFNAEIEELVWRSKSFNDAFKDQLVMRFKKLFPQHASRKEIIRFLYGFYSKPKDIHKRPLTKVKQDVAAQLDML